MSPFRQRAAPWCPFPISSSACCAPCTGGSRIRAKSILAGGQSGDPASPHFNDQAEMYARGEFKDVLFYKDDVLKNLERQYHPGL